VSFGGVVFHVAAAAEDLDGVIGDAVAHFAGVVFGHGCEHAGESFVFFLLLFESPFFGFVGDVAEFELSEEAVFDVDVEGGFVGEGAGGFEVGFHVDEEFANGGELFDGGAELFSAGGVFAGDAEGGFGDAEGLGGDADAGAVHEAHDVGDEASLSFADEL